MVGGPDQRLGPFDAQGVAVFQKRLDVLFRVSPDIDTLFDRLSNDLVIDVGDVHYVLKSPPLALEVSAKDVFEDKRSEISDVGKVVDGGPADIHPHCFSIRGNEFFELAGQRVGELQHVGCKERTNGNAARRV